MKKQTILFSVLSFLAITLILSSCAKKKSELLMKEWKVKEVMAGDMKLEGDLASGFLTLKNDSTFSFLETGKTRTGKWSLSADETKVTLNYKDETPEVYTISELTEEKLVMEGEVFSMKKKYTFELKK